MNKKKKGIFTFVILTIVGLTIVMTLTDASAGASPSLITPYVDENDMESINEAFSVDECAPWGFGDHLGIDLFPTGVIGDPNEYKSFQSVCSGTVVSISPYYNPAGGPNGIGQHQVNVEIEYDSTYSVIYAFETWSDIQADGDAQLSNIFSHIELNDIIPQGHIIGELFKAGDAAHIHFGLRENGMDVCPEPYFTPGARISILNVLHKIHPHARMCYGLEATVPTANIVVDGNTADWSGVNVLAWDWQDVFAPDFPGADIQALYLARDATNLYLRLDLWENANPNFGNAPDPYRGRYSFRLENSGPYPDLFLSVAGGYIQWSLGFNGSNGPGTPALLDNRPDLVGVIGNVIEVKVPLWIIGFPTEFQLIYAEVSDCCIDPNNVTVVDETHCISNLHTTYEPIPEPPQQSIQNLISSMNYLPIPKGLKKSLIKKLESALSRIEKGQTHTTINNLNAFIHEINAQRGKKISYEIADQLIAEAQRIIEILQPLEGC
jgi:hypothetical protein